MENETFVCDRCNLTLPVTRRVVFDGEELCESCYDELTADCERCGERIWLDDNAGNSQTVLCEDCYEDHYTHCSHCGTLLPRSEAYYEEDDDGDEAPYCADCYGHYVDNRAIHSYGYKPEPIFYGDGSRYFGIELEIDDGGKRSDNAVRILNIANREQPLAYIKTDGSLEDGLEIVTHPLTRDFHQQQMPWEDILHACIDMGYLSHRSGTCGLHLHVNRSCFGETEEEQDECISRVMYFVERFWQELLRFSRRTERQVQRWAARYGYKDKPKEILDHAKKSYGNRYSCVNITNLDTIEFRIFRGTLKYNTLIATLQMVDKICDVAICLSDEELASLSWPEFVSGLDPDKNAELITYLKERRLYVNEPVAVEEDA